LNTPARESVRRLRPTRRREDMYEDRNGLASSMETIKSIAAVIATVIGLIVMVIGLKYTVDIFYFIYDALRTPELLNGMIQDMANSIGGDAFTLNVGKKVFPMANIMALMVYCGGSVALAWVAMGLIRTGARIVSWTSGDREAVKQILHYAFGNAMRPKMQTTEDRVKRKLG